MTPAEFATHVRFMTRTNSTTFTDAEILALMKIRQDEIAKEIIDADEDILLIPQYTSLVANQREYSLPNDMLASIKRVEAKLDGTNYIKLRELDIVSLTHSILTESDITENFSNEEDCAFFDLTRKALYIYSGTITSVTDGLRVWCNTWAGTVANLTDTTDMSNDPSTTSHGIPRELHEIWARGVIIDWKSSRENPIPLSEKELSYKLDKIAAINSLKPQNRERDVIGSLPSASEIGNNGADY
jgi:hypothetical protein